MFSPYPGCHAVRSAISDFFWNIDKGRMWQYNILGDNGGIISHLSRLDIMTARSILLTDILVALKRGYSEYILMVKRFEWRKFIHYFGLSTEANPSRVGKNNIHFVRIGSIPSTSSGNNHKSRHQCDKYFNLEPPKLQLYQLTKMLAAEIVPHVYSVLRGLCVISYGYILSRSPILTSADRAGTAYLCYGTTK